MGGRRFVLQKYPFFAGAGLTDGSRQFVLQFFIARRHALAGCKVMVHLYYDYSCSPAEAQGGY